MLIKVRSGILKDVAYGFSPGPSSEGFHLDRLTTRLQLAYDEPSTRRMQLLASDHDSPPISISLIAGSIFVLMSNFNQGSLVVGSTSYKLAIQRAVYDFVPDKKWIEKRASSSRG